MLFLLRRRRRPVHLNCARRTVPHIFVEICEEPRLRSRWTVVRKLALDSQKNGDVPLNFPSPMARPGRSAGFLRFHSLDQIFPIIFLDLSLQLDFDSFGRSFLCVSLFFLSWTGGSRGLHRQQIRKRCVPQRAEEFPCRILSL